MLMVLTGRIRKSDFPVYQSGASIPASLLSAIRRHLIRGHKNVRWGNLNTQNTGETLLLFTKRYLCLLQFELHWTVLSRFWTTKGTGLATVEATKSRLKQMHLETPSEQLQDSWWMNGRRGRIPDLCCCDTEWVGAQRLIIARKQQVHERSTVHCNQ